MIYVGIDIAKLNHFASAISSDGEELIKPFKFTNDADGFQLLSSHLDSLPDDSFIIGLESTVHQRKKCLPGDVKNWLPYHVKKCLPREGAKSSYRAQSLFKFTFHIFLLLQPQLVIPQFRPPHQEQ